MFIQIALYENRQNGCFLLAARAPYGFVTRALVWTTRGYNEGESNKEDKQGQGQQDKVNQGHVMHLPPNTPKKIKRVNLLLFEDTQF